MKVRIIEHGGEESWVVREDNKHIIEQPVKEMGRRKVSEGVRTGFNMILILFPFRFLRTTDTFSKPRGYVS